MEVHFVNRHFLGQAQVDSWPKEAWDAKAQTNFPKNYSEQFEGITHEMWGFLELPWKP